MVMEKSREQHGESQTILFRRWGSMRNRCSPKWKHRKNYYDRGIDIVPEWDSFICFKSWALANRYDPKLELDREDNDKGYSPENCRWVTKRINNFNKRNTISVEWDGKVQPVVIVCENLGMTIIHRKAVINRILRGWDSIRAIKTPIMTDTYTSKKKISVINTITKIVYPTIKAASEDYGIERGTLSQKLNGRLNNDTPFEYYND